MKNQSLNHSIEENPRRILIICSYYRPYISGLTSVATVLAESLAQEGFQVSVLCHNHDKRLPEIEVLNKVTIHRAKPFIRLNRATFSFDFFVKFWKLRMRQNIINIHLPLPEAGFLRFNSNQELITTYHCDVPKTSIVMKLISKLIDVSSIKTLNRSKKVVFTSLDYMEFSRMRKFAIKKTVEIYPFVNSPSQGNLGYHSQEGRRFGYLGRFTSEKGVLFLIDAFQNGASKEDLLLLAGSTKLAGDSIYHLVQKKASGDSRIRLYPDIEKGDIPAFYNSLTAFCFPSLNSFEAFGISQVEALLYGVPVLTSNLPGVRVPVEKTGMGKILRTGDLQDWSDAIEQFDRSMFSSEISAEMKASFSSEAALLKYIQIFSESKKF